MRRIHGPDALVVSTRTVWHRDEEGLAPRRQVEVEVAATEPGPAASPLAAYRSAASDSETTQPSAAGGEGEDPREAVQARLRRLQEIAARVERMAGRVGALSHEVLPYPLAAALRRTGTTERTLLELAHSFDLAARGGERSPTAARRHLSRTVRATHAVSLGQMRGEHWFLGRAGVGKTTLVLYLAGRLRAAGLEVGLVGMNPAHSGEVQRLAAAGRAMDVDVRVAAAADDFERARQDLAGNDVVLVDTPCHLGRSLLAVPGETAQRHLVVSLGEDREFLRRQLEEARDWTPDCVAISQMDLFPRPGRIVDLCAEVQRPVSFLAGRYGAAFEVVLARGEALLQVVLDEDSAEAAPLEAAAAAH